MIISTIYAINLNHHSEFIHPKFTAVYGHNQQSLASMLAVLAQDSNSGIIDYGDTGVLHKNQNASHFSHVFNLDFAGYQPIFR